MKILGPAGPIALQTFLLFLLESIIPARSKAFFILLILTLYGISIARQQETIFIFTYKILVTYYLSVNILSFVQMLNNLILTQS